MDGILALGHFCETHGPCVILCTQRSKEEPKQYSSNLTVPWCESCQSVEIDQAFVSKEGEVCYFTSRAPLQQELSYLLKQAVVRSLSCEDDTSKEGAALYFGDNERGHVLSHTFILNDSLARGFHRKYSIILLMKDKVHLLNSWPALTKYIKEIATDLQQKAASINGVEQAQKPQRAVRQTQGSPSSPARSLSQLTGEPAVFAHIHMWFTFILSTENLVEKPTIVPTIPVNSKPTKLRKLVLEMDENVFRTSCYCVLTGIHVQMPDEVLEDFRQLLPSNFILPTTGEMCKLIYVKNKWLVEWSGRLPTKLPTLLTKAERILKDENIQGEALESHLTSIVFHWYNIACSLRWTPTQNTQLFQALGVQKYDLPLLAYWTTQCKV